MENNNEAYRSDEDIIIETIVIESKSRMHEDTDFLPIRQSLYNVTTVVPEWDLDNLREQVWVRPHSLCSAPAYFSGNNISAIQGNMPDEVFIGALLATSTYLGADLLENIFASRPEDFTEYGVFTCRFYVNGQWVEVVTDTNIPCKRDEVTQENTPLYSMAKDPNDMWILLAEKAYAKAVGSFEAITKVKIHEALLHLTGGSVQQFNLIGNAEINNDPHAAFKIIHDYLNDDTMILVLPIDKNEKVAVNEEDDESLQSEMKSMDVNVNKNVQQNGFIQNRLYSVICTRNTHDFELVLLHNPWAQSPNAWTGEWSSHSHEWDNNPEILQNFESDPTIPWSRKKSNGYFWMNMVDFMKSFNSVFANKLFLNNKYSFYCVHGNWFDKLAGGSATTVRDRNTVCKDAAESRVLALQKATAATVIDGDTSWFNNPQYRLHCEKPTQVYISLVPDSAGSNDGLHLISLSVTAATKSHISPMHLWDASSSEIVMTDKIDGQGKYKGQEASIWDFNISPDKYYHIVPHTLRKGLEGAFILRVYSTEPIVVEKVDPLPNHLIKGEWRKTAELDTTGGPLTLSSDGSTVKENTKWCQNPQFHLEIVNPFGKEEVHCKIVLRRTDKQVGIPKNTDPMNSKAEVCVGMVVCKADVLLESSNIKKKSGGPRQNPMGEIIPLKESSLIRKKKNIFAEEEPPPKTEARKTVLRKTVIASDSYSVQTSYSHKSESCIYYPKIPRAWMPNGLIIVPCLTEKNIKGTFEIEVYSSEPMILNQLPEAFSRTIAGEWIEGMCGGSHLNNTWKKNPRFSLKPRMSVNKGVGSSIRVRITLTRHGTAWRNMVKKDTVGCMIGFYIFANRGGEMQQIFDSTFVPAEENSTDPSFVLDLVQPDEEFIIMPATFADAKLGSFVLSVLSEIEFVLARH